MPSFPVLPFSLPDLNRHLLPYLANPLVLLCLFVVASMLMIWRLNAIEGKGFEGTVLGTLIMPYCSGAANLMFAFVMSRAGSDGRVVMENCLVNNATNLTLILGLATLLAKNNHSQGSRGKAGKAAAAERINRLELLFTLVALFLFTGTLWALAKDGVVDFYDGLVLVGLFVFWQLLHVFEVLKNNVRKSRRVHWSIVVDLLLIGVCAYGVYVSVDRLVDWVSHAQGRWLNAGNLGWLSGGLMVLPNAFLALYYARTGRQDIVVSSQVGDGHICIPMCLGLFALGQAMPVPGFFMAGIYVIAVAGLVHFLSLALLGRLPRLLGIGLLGGYGAFLYQGLIP